ncbi:uncharacterized protein Z520_04602 [Fonsecaea multimorphosa CBS 102226]|uniref:Xylanolytic transcriptional activator regulatory domain-containing protein n=1 Tax=Fonsecaea multimorphosa CBS 102226 TaxID=1442371 RepID=A0A0D2KA01_9EURO|nr:uncharacterized protein Z520_04602 [Fonsecaea multimorphosa CBS 102226]KIX99964.1 hypothetical protein Z520_04602 [Fonsecaea multimorphosa CBS 102226]OAL26178.1 hypothetical protein AYO22_04356 [Fonsecaea multimorphosa]
MKARCSGDYPSCNRCYTKGIECVYPSRDRRQVGTGSSEVEQSLAGVTFEGASETASRSSPLLAEQPSQVPPAAALIRHPPLLTRERVLEAIQAFFQYLQPLPSLAVLHKASLLRLVHQDQADRALLFSIVAITSHTPGAPASHREIGSRCADLAEELILAEFRQPSIFKLQALLFVIRYRIWTASHNAAFLLMAQLTRSAFALRINHETLRPSFYVQEARRRLMWAIYILDSTMACGLQEYTLCPITAIHLRLPAVEDDFELNNENVFNQIRENGPQSVRLGILAYYVRIINLHDEILRCKRQAMSSRSDFRVISSRFQSLEKDLETFVSRLPPGEQFSERNLALRAYSPRLPRYVMTHIWWNHCHCQLFRGTIPALGESLPQEYLDHLGLDVGFEQQVKCLLHAQTIAQILSSLLEIEGGTWALEYEMAECAHSATEVLLAIDASQRARLGISTEDIVRDVTVCLELIRYMSGMYPAITDIEQALLSVPQGLLEKPRLMKPTREIVPRQFVPRHTVLGNVGFTDDSPKLEMTPSAKNRTPIQPSEPPSIGAAIQTPPEMPNDAHPAPFALQEPFPNLEPTGDVELGDGFPYLESVSSAWDQMSLFQDPFDGFEQGTEEVL